MKQSPVHENVSTQFYAQHFSGNAAENYERYFVPVIGGPLASDLVEKAALQPGERVLDVACGTGIVARLAAERVGSTGKVAAVDLNPAMLAVARAAKTAGVSISWHESPAEKLPFPDESFDVVLCQLGLQFFPDKPAALREMRRVLAPGGRLWVRVVGPVPQLFQIFDQALERHIHPQAKAFVGAVFSLHDKSELEGLLNSAGFQEVAIRAETGKLRLPPPKDFLWQYIHSTPLADLIGQAGSERHAALERDVVGQWQQFVENGGMRLEVRDIVANARRL